uniref:Uncharacterized protein n=1 Tax=Rhizophora mucronata TaxID=61149 RepID=A0A2P2LCH6_RHIMU
MWGKPVETARLLAGIIKGMTATLLVPSLHGWGDSLRQLSVQELAAHMPLFTVFPHTPTHRPPQPHHVYQYTTCFHSHHHIYYCLPCFGTHHHIQYHSLCCFLPCFHIYYHSQHFPTFPLNTSTFDSTLPSLGVPRMFCIVSTRNSLTFSSTPSTSFKFSPPA